MIPLIVSTAHIRTLLGILFREYSTPEIKRVDRSDNIIIPSRDYLEKSWQPWWNDWRNEELGPNNGYFCELYAGFASLQFHKVAFDYCKKKGYRDAGGALFLTSIDIIKPPFMGIDTLSHWTCIQAWNDNGNVQFALWEPQNNDGHLAPLEIAIASETIIIKTIDL